MKRIVFFLSAVMMFAACNSRQNEALTKKSSSGKTNEVLLAADKGHYYGITRDLIDSIFREVQPCLPQPEPRSASLSTPLSKSCKRGAQPQVRKRSKRLIGR